MIRVVLIFLFIVTSSVFAEVIDTNKKSVDCLILQDEDSIVCKYMHDRLEEDKQILVKWISPDGEISRERTLVIPAGHGSIYDFRYIQGRQKGSWTFIVKDEEEEYSTTFELH